MYQLFEDVRRAARSLRGAATFSCVAIMTLSLGVGAATAVFSIADPFLIRTLPVHAPDELVALRGYGSSFWDTRALVPRALYEEVASNTTVFSGVFAFEYDPSFKRVRIRSGSVDATDEVFWAEPVSGNYFRVVGVEPALGRFFSASDDEAGLPALAVLSHGLWRQRYGADPRIIGEEILLDDASGLAARAATATIVGVAPVGFYGVDADADPDLWILLTPYRLTRPALDSRAVGMMARLAAGASLEAAQAEVDVLAAAASASARSGWPDGVRVEAAAKGYSGLRSEFASSLYVLMAAAALVLFIVCANVAALLLARGVARRREVAIRLALGSSLWRVRRQVIAEALILAAGGGALAFVLAHWIGLVMKGYFPPDIGFTERIDLDTRALVFATLASLGGMALFAFLPTVRAGTSADPGPALRSSSTQRQLPMQDARLIRIVTMIQVALSLMLLVGAGLLVRSLENLRAIETGFDQQNVLQFSIDTSSNSALSSVNALQQVGLDRLESLPGVESATVYFRSGLLSGEDQMTSARASDDIMSCGAVSSISAMYVGPRFFETMGISLISGRGLRTDDGVGRAVVISEGLARYLFGTVESVGRRLDWGGGFSTQLEIVGIAEETTYSTLREPTDWAVYMAAPQFYLQPGNARFSVRTEGDASRMASAVRRVVGEIGEDLYVTDVRTFSEIRESSISRERVAAQFVGGFAVVALILASLGVYGVLSYAVTHRADEIAIRIALGAQTSQVARLILRETATVMGSGILLGLAGAWALAQVMRALLFGVSPLDLVSIVGAALILLVAASIAAYLPARRASGIDPMAAIRNE